MSARGGKGDRELWAFWGLRTESQTWQGAGLPLAAASVKKDSHMPSAQGQGAGRVNRRWQPGPSSLSSEGHIPRGLNLNEGVLRPLPTPQHPPPRHMSASEFRLWARGQLQTTEKSLCGSHCGLGRTALDGRGHGPLSWCGSQAAAHRPVT